MSFIIFFFFFLDFVVNANQRCIWPTVFWWVKKTALKKRVTVQGCMRTSGVVLKRDMCMWCVIQNLLHILLKKQSQNCQESEFQFLYSYNQCLLVKRYSINVWESVMTIAMVNCEFHHQFHGGLHIKISFWFC